MDVRLSFIMTNLAKVKENDLVLDLFCGSGKLKILSIFLKSNKFLTIPFRTFMQVAY